ncbi:hypothetical protein I547_4467 [Mycobacterium kansasii 824]|nr:hypothetical protein I547_4467 [Mycobacterium kansasii 824]
MLSWGSLAKNASTAAAQSSRAKKCVSSRAGGGRPTAAWPRGAGWRRLLPAAGWPRPSSALAVGHRTRSSSRLRSWRCR